MERLKILTHKGKEIIYGDFSHLKASSKQEFIDLMKETKNHIVQQPPHSVLILTNVTETGFNSEIILLFVEFTNHNAPYAKSSAVIGVNGLLNIALRTITKSAGRNIQAFATEAEALDWLATQ